MINSTLVSKKLQEEVLPRTGDQRRGVLRSMNRSLFEEWQAGNYKALDQDYAEVIHAFYQGDKRFRDAYDAIKVGGTEYKDNVQAIAEAISLSQFGDFVNSQYRMGTYEMCGSPSYAPILSLFPRRFVDCGTDVRYTNPQFVDFEAPLVTEGENTQYFGLGEVAKITDPEKEEIRFGMQLNRSFLCIDPNQQARTWIRNQMFEVIRRRALRQLLGQLLNVNCGTSSRDPNFDGTQYNPYLQCGPWCNLFYNQDDFNCACQHPAILACEYMEEDMRNPLTGDPMECSEGMNVMTFSRQTSRYVADMLGPHLAKKKGSLDCEGCEINRASREGWGQVLYSKWGRKILHELICEEFPTAVAGEIDQMLDRTLIVGNFGAALEWQVIWDTEITERSGTETSEYHRNNTIYSAVISEYSGAAWDNPWAVKKVYGLPDTLATVAVTLPTACTDDHPMCGASETAG